MMSREKQLSNISKELGCTLMRLTRRTILLREKKFQDCRGSLRQSMSICTAEEFSAAEDEINMLWSLRPSRSKMERKCKTRNFEESREHFH